MLMKVNFCFSVSLFLAVVLHGVLAPAAHAQRADNSRPNDPFGRRVVPARAVPGGRYRSHEYVNGFLSVRATDGSTLQVWPWATGVVKVVYLAPGRVVTAILR